MLRQVRFRWLWLVASGAAITAAGCSAITSFTGLAGVDEDGGSQSTDASADRRVSTDANSVPDTSTDVGPTACNASKTIAAALTKDMGSFTPYSTFMGYPNVEPFFGDTALVLLPFRDTSLVDAGPDADPVPKQSEIKDVNSGIWLTTPLPLTSFDVSFEAQIRCTSAGSCADGLIFAWLDTTNATLLSNKTYGNGAGVPDMVGGGGIDIDNYKNDSTESNDPYAPSLQILALDATKAAGRYQWWTAIEKVSFADAWHKYTIKQRGGAVTLTFDGAMQLTATIPTVKTGLVGLTAGTGGESDAVAVRAFSGTFYDCVAP